MSNMEYNKSMSDEFDFCLTDFEGVVSHGLMYSYTSKSTQPIVFSHYHHRQTKASVSDSPNPLGRCIMIIYLSGNCKITKSDKTYRLSYGDILIANSYEHLYCETEPGCILDYYQIDIPDCFFESVYNPAFFSDIFYGRNIMEGNLVRLNDSQKERCINRIKRIEELLSGNSHHYDILAYSYFVQMVNTLNEQSGIITEKSGSSLIPSSVIKAIEYIHKNFTTMESIDELIQVSNTSAVYLRKMFKKVTGYTIGEYVRNQKINYAKKLLKSDTDITTVALESGFNGSSYFIATFKKQTGMTPLKYKHMHKNEE